MSKFVYFFLMFWGLMFGGIPLTLYLTGEITIPETPFLLNFVAIGVIVFIVGLRMLLKDIRFGIVRKKGIKTMGIFSDRACGVTVNGTPMYYIKFSYMNDEGKSVEFKTPSIYTIRQAEFYEKLGRFEIKYMHNVAVISQPVDYRLLDKMKENEKDKDIPDYYQPTDERPEVKQGYYFCDYCGNEIGRAHV